MSTGICRGIYQYLLFSFHHSPPCSHRRQRAPCVHADISCKCFIRVYEFLACTFSLVAFSRQRPFVLVVDHHLLFSVSPSLRGELLEGFGCTDLGRARSHIHFIIIVKLSISFKWVFFLLSHSGCISLVHTLSASTSTSSLRARCRWSHLPIKPHLSSLSTTTSPSPSAPLSLHASNI